MPPGLSTGYMDEKDFHNILRKYLRGEASAEEKQLIDAWYRETGKDTDTSLTHEEESECEDRYWSAVSAHIQGGKKKNKIALVWYASGIAASLLLAVAAYFYFVDVPAKVKNMSAYEDHPASSHWQQVENAQRVAEIVFLPDSSKVTLQPKSRLKFLTSFPASRREVYLEGEAFFEVQHDSTRPFFVYANEVTTKVLGTSFTIKARRDESKITVSVRTGRVAVSTDRKTAGKPPKNDAVILTPNQQFVYDKHADKISQQIVDEPQIIVPDEEFRRMRFEEAPVPEIFDAIEKVYGVEIVCDRERFSTCLLTTAISDGGIYNRLDIICKAIDASYSLNENKIVISGKGCE